MPALRFLLAIVFFTALVHPSSADPLPGTKPLTAEGDLAAKMVAGIDKYLMRELTASVEKRKQFWKPDRTLDWKAFAESVKANRARLRKMIGVSQRLPVTDLEYVATTSQPSLIAETDTYRVYTVRWPVLEGVHGEGLLLEPKGKALFSVVAIPDADWTPEMIVGLAPGLHKEAQYARALAENSCRVLVPTLIDRQDTWSGNAKLGRWTNQPHREFIYRMAFEMGTHIIGYEVQKVLAAVDWLKQQPGQPDGIRGGSFVSVVGHGEGGLLALYAGAVDERIWGVEVSGYFGPREQLWQEPIYRNVWGLLREFGDAELGLLISPKNVIAVHACDWPKVEGPPSVRPGRSGAAPGRLQTPAQKAVSAEYDRIDKIGSRGGMSFWGTGGFVAPVSMLEQIVWPRVKLKEIGPQPPTDLRKDFDPASRQHRQFDQLVNHTQKLMRESEAQRQAFFWSKLDTSSVEKYEKSTEPLRNYFWEEVIGKLPAAHEPMNPQSRKIYDTPKWKGYEVTLDLYPDVFAYGILLVPKDMKPGEKRPVVVCQHGLEGRPSDVCNPKEKTRYYNSYGAQLADLGYIVFAPQNPYIGKDDFRVLQRKANPLGLSFFSFIVRQHETILDWLAMLPFVDPQRIAFYGLSYGGKTAMRVPALLSRYCLSICSGDFNEWIVKNVSVDFRGSYMFTGEYEMFEFDLGNTFNYAEMAGLIAPRPFMVERGHDDPVGIDEMVAYEYAKVRRLYSRLKLPQRTAIEFFPGGHEINGQGTFAFLKKHLNYPQ